MRESDEELTELQALMDASLAQATGHLMSIIRPGRTLTAPQLARVIEGMCTLAVSSVTASGEPRVSGADGHFLHGRWVFTTERSSAKARHFAVRPAVSLAHLRGDIWACSPTAGWRCRIRGSHHRTRNGPPSWTTSRSTTAAPR